MRGICPTNLSIFILTTGTQAFNHHLSSLSHSLSSSSSSYISSQSSIINKLNKPWGSIPIPIIQSPSTLQMTPFIDDIRNEESKPFIETENDLSNVELLVNAAIVTFSFGFALYTILNIDSGMTRGWTQAETMLRIPVDSWRGYEDSLAAKPMMTKTMINTVVYLLGDWLSQTLFQRRNVLDFDVMRTLRNGCIGALFGPYAHKYYEFSDWILPMSEPVNRIYKILLDQTFFMGSKIATFLFMVIFLAGGTFEESKNNLTDKFKDVMFTAWRFWPFVHCITYTVIPTQHRLLWVSAVDLFWNAILAFLARGQSFNQKEEDVEMTAAAISEDLAKVEEKMMDNVFYFADTVSSGNSTFTEMRDLENIAFNDTSKVLA